MPRLWKTPVEKPVEIVENSELSTGFFALFFFLLFLWKSLHISMHIPFSAQKRDVLRHRRKEAVTGKTSGKSCLPVKKCCRKPLALSLNCEKFVKNRQRMIWRFRGILERNGNGSSISQYHHTGGCHAGKSRDMRRQHIETSRFISGGNGRPAPPGAGGRRRRPGKTH